VTDYLNISEVDRRKSETSLPLRFNVSEGMFNRGSFSIKNDGDKKAGEIKIKSKDDNESRLEETTHYVHATANNKLQDAFLEISRDYEWIRNEKTLSVDDDLVVADRAKEITFQDLDEMALRLGLDTVSSPESSEEIVTAIKTMVGGRGVEGRHAGNGLLTAGQAIRLGAAIERVFGKLDGDDLFERTGDRYISMSKALVKAVQSGDRENEETSNLRDRKFEIQDELVNGLAEKIHNLLKDPENISVLAQVFEQTFISLDGVTFRSNQLSRQIDVLSGLEAKQRLSDLLHRGCSVDELLYVSQLFPGKWTENVTKVEDSRKNGNNEMRVTTENIRHDLIDELDRLNLTEIDSNSLRETMKVIIKQVKSTATTAAEIEAELVYLMDDFPADEKVMKDMLGNPEYMRAYIQAVVAALSSGDFVPNNIRFDVSSFSKNADVTRSVSEETLLHSFSDPEMAIFFQKLVGKTEDRRSRALSADYVTMYGNWQLDAQFIADGIDMRGPINQDLYETELSKAKTRSYELIRRRQQLDKGIDLRDILIEPIAKVLVAQKLNLGREDVVFTENVLGGYSKLLHSEDFSKWIDTLWIFLEKIHEDKLNGGDVILQFFKCGTVSEQEKIVSNYLK